MKVVEWEDCFVLKSALFYKRFYQYRLNLNTEGIDFTMFDWFHYFKLILLQLGLCFHLFLLLEVPWTCLVFFCWFSTLYFSFLDNNFIHTVLDLLSLMRALDCWMKYSISYELKVIAGEWTAVTVDILSPRVLGHQTLPVPHSRASTN